jgi:uncharacterized membrane protein YbhN (UPF0104 family)
MPSGLNPAVLRTAQAGAPILISAAALVFIGQSMDWRDVAADAMRAPAWAVAGTVTLVALQLALCGDRLARLSASVSAPVGRPRATAIWGVSYLAGLTLPTSVGSELVKGGLLLRWMKFPGRILGVVALERLLALAAMGLVVLLAAPMLAHATGYAYAWPVTLLCALGLAATLAVSLLRRRMFGWLRLALVRLRTPAAAAEAIERTLNEAPLGRVLLTSALVHVLTLAMIGLLATGLGLTNPWLVALVGGPAVVLASMLPISIGGLGVREGAAIVIFGLLGAGAEEAAGVALALWGCQVLAGVLSASAAGAWMLHQRAQASPATVTTH